ncbi:carbamate kinase [Keratinibaculum paraultunense]|uniref:Carbamate kinase n=1 Tax=Keratinibaculum paraultunense TaxID=1278232 RepID=A0A4R3L0X1_9FIRM|nr:carbamate kinase [Keratinibaculum paraultunense]
MKIVVALGGNALQNKDSDFTSESQLNIIRKSVKHLVDIIEKGHDLIITHGNGPQIGRIIIQNEIAKGITPAMPFDVCGAMSQGMIGYHIQQALGDEIKERGKKKSVATIITQIVVDKDDDGFKNPTKPIGPFYSKEEALRLKEEKGYEIIEDSGRGYRRVVASPKPKKIVEIETIRTLVDNGNIVIAAGGGGIPVIEEGSKLRGVEAVIDKDLASERLAKDIDADILLILTAVDKVYLNYRKTNERGLNKVGVVEMKKYIEQGHFAPGSMLPKVLASIGFVESKRGRKAIITSLDKANTALCGLSGTIIE